MRRYLHYDVFTDRRFEGNQLAVFPDGGGLGDAMIRLDAEREVEALASDAGAPPQADSPDDASVAYCVL